MVSSRTTAQVDGSLTAVRRRRTEEPTASKGPTSWGFPLPRTGRQWLGLGALAGVEVGPRELLAGRDGDRELGERTAHASGLSSTHGFMLVEQTQRTARSGANKVS